jgi:hypothetical protein
VGAQRSRQDRVDPLPRHPLSGPLSSKQGCQQRAAIQVECRDNIGHPFWNRDYCEAHAKPVIEKAERLKIPVSWL